MLVQLGPRSAPQDLAEALAECHVRIRRFLELARRLAGSPAVAESEIHAVAMQIKRYFTVAFPLHVADEEDLVPHLRGREPALDDALARMHADHADHAGLVTRLIAICGAIEHDPRQLVARHAELLDAAEALAAVIEPHLAIEEQTIFPALRALPRDVADQLRAGMQRRRDHALATPR